MNMASISSETAAAIEISSCSGGGGAGGEGGSSVATSIGIKHNKQKISMISEK